MRQNNHSLRLRDRRATGKEQVMTNDNTTSHHAHEYDKGIRQTIPFHSEFHAQAIDIIRQKGAVTSLLDIGCGTGSFEQKLLAEFPRIQITAIDPSEKMLAEAQKKTAGASVTYLRAASEDLQCEDRFDVVTAIQSHHYLHEEQRRQATANVLRALHEGGLYISFENVIPNSERLKAFELERWKRFQIRAGKTEDAAAAHIQRCGVNYFPITVEQHVHLLEEAGFTDVLVFWRSYMQMGVMGFKG